MTPQAIEVEKAGNPYLGPRPFMRADAYRFFGRNREAAELCSLVAAHRTVLLYAQSGAGKSSLLNAGVVPLLEERGFEVLPTARVSGKGRDTARPGAGNIYALNAAGCWGGDATAPNVTLAATLASRPRPKDASGEDLPRVAIFDQFEELFTAYPERWQERAEFFNQLDEAMTVDPSLRVLLAMREDFVAQIDAYEDLLPEEFRTRYRLEQLRFEAALSAVQCPLQGTGISFKPGVAELLVKDLLRTPVTPSDLSLPPQHLASATQQSSAGYVMGEFVEPVQLQVVCFSLFRNLPPGTTEITEEQVKTFGDVDQALKNFYASALQEAANKTGLDEDRLRQWFESELLTETGSRGLVFRGDETTGGIANAAVDVLEELHIVRAEVRGRNRWYELSHDRFIQPILRANDSWRLRMQEAEKLRQEEEKRKLVRKTQLLWAGLIAAMALVVAVTWLAFYANREEKEAYRQRIEANTQRQEALNQAQQAESAKQTAETEKQNADAARNHADSMSQMAIEQAKIAEAEKKDADRQREEALRQQRVADAARQNADTQSKNADKQRQEADKQRGVAEQMRWTDIWKVLAYEAPQQTDAADDDLAGLLAREAFLIHQRSPEQPNDLVDHALFALCPAPEFRHVLRSNDFNSPTTFSPDGQKLASGGGDNTVRIYDLRQPQAAPLVLAGHKDPVWSVAFSPDGQKLASGSGDKTVRIWNLREPQAAPLVLTGHKDVVWSVAFSPDGRWVAAGGVDKTIRIWDLQQPQAAPRVLKGHERTVASVKFSPDGQKLASASEDATIRIWDLSQPQAAPLVLKGHQGEVLSVAFNPDGERLASGSADKTIRLWDLRHPTAAPQVLEGSRDAVISVAFQNLRCRRVTQVPKGEWFCPALFRSKSLHPD